MVRDLGLGPALLGITVACGGAGSLVGAALAGRIVSSWGVGPTIVGTALAGSGAALLIPLAGGPVLLAALVLMVAQFVGVAAATDGQIAATSVRQAAASDRLLGCANAVAAGLLELAWLVCSPLRQLRDTADLEATEVPGRST